MATPISELLVKISADSSGLETGLSKAGQSTDDFAKNAAEAIGSIMVAWEALQLVAEGVQYNAMAEQAEVAFSTMLDSASAAQSLIEEMVDFAKTTPFDFPGVRDAGKQLLAFGIEAEDIIPTLKMLGDVGSGIGAPIGDLAYLFGTIATQGKAMTQDLNQFANRGIPIWEELAKVVGASGSELRKMVEAGEIGFPEIEAAFQNMAGEGGKFFNLMDKQSKTFDGALSNMNDSLGELGGEMTKSLMVPLKGVVQAITALAGAIGDMPQPVKDTALAFGLVGTALVAASGAAKAFGMSLNMAVAGPIGVAVAAIGALTIGMAGYIEENNKAIAAQKEFQDQVGQAKAGELQGDTNKQIEKTVQLIEELRKKWKEQMRIQGEELRAGRQGYEKYNSTLYYTQLYSKQENDLLAQKAKLEAQLEEERKASENQKRMEAALATQKEINNWLAVQDQLLKAGAITEEEYYKNRIKFQEERIAKIKEEGEAAGRLTAAQIAKIQELQGHIETYQAKLDAWEDSRPEKVQARLDAEKEIQIAADTARAEREIKAIEDRQKLEADAVKAYDERQKEVDANAQARLDAQRQAQEKYWADVSAIASAGFDVISAIDAELGTGMGEILGNLESISGGIMKLFQTGGMDPSAWAQTIVGAIGLIGDAFDLLSGEEAKRAEEARQAEIKALEENARARLETKLAALEKERQAELEAANKIGADTSAIEIYYARETAKAKLALNEEIEKRSAQIIAESEKAIADARYRARVDAEKKLQDDLAKIISDAEKTFGDSEFIQKTKADYIARETEKAKQAFSKNLADLTQAYIDDAMNGVNEINKAFVIWEERAADASQGIGSALISGLKSGQTEEEIKDSIFEMLEGMAIEAAIMAAGIGDKFEAIGASIADALADGFMSETELGGIETAIDQLYKDASASVEGVTTIFKRLRTDEPVTGGQIGDGTQLARSGAPIININSPVAVDPVESSRILTRTMQSLSFTGAI